MTPGAFIPISALLADQGANQLRNLGETLRADGVA